MAMGALSCDIAVGEKLVGLLVIELHRTLLHKLPVVIETAEKLRRRGRMDIARGARIDVKRHTQLLKTVFYYFVVTVNNILGGHTLSLGLDGDRHPMLIAPADHDNILATHPQETGIDVGGNINPGQMAYMHRPVGIGQRGCHKCPFELFFHNLHLNLCRPVPRPPML